MTVDRDRAGGTPLHYAAIDAPVDLDHTAALSDPALKAENHRKIVEFILTNSRRLLDTGADVNATNTTPAKLAIVRLLREHSADPTIPAHDGFSALKYVERYGKPELREAFADLL